MDIPMMVIEWLTQFAAVMSDRTSSPTKVANHIIMLSPVFVWDCFDGRRVDEMDVWLFTHQYEYQSMIRALLRTDPEKSYLALDIIRRDHGKITQRRYADAVFSALGKPLGFSRFYLTPVGEPMGSSWMVADKWPPHLSDSMTFGTLVAATRFMVKMNREVA